MFKPSVRSFLLGALALGSTTEAFAPPRAPLALTEGLRRNGLRPTVQMNAFAGLAKKMKMKEIAGLREAHGDLLKLRGTRVVSTPGLAAVLKKRAGTLSLIAEYRRKGAGITKDDLLPPAIMSRDFRMGGASAVSVLLDKATGGCTVADAEELVSEQATAQGDFPGPCPLIWHDFLIDEVQLAMAANAGASAVLLSCGALGGELGAMATAASEYGLEVLFEVKSPAEAAVLDAAGLASGVVCMAGMSVDDMVALAPTLQAAAVKVAFLPLYDDSQLIEAEDAWRLRDAGVNAIWASEVLYKFGYGDGENTMSVIRAIKSKGSVKYARASGAYNQQGEGAKEWLGDICM